MDARFNAEHEITEAAWLVNRILADGYTISVCDGEEWPVKRSTNADEILEGMGSTGEDMLKVRSLTETPGKSVAIFELIYGNGPGELIADSSDSEYAATIFEEYSNKFPL